MRRLLISLLFLFSLSFWTCDLPWDPGPRPSELIHTEYVESLNVFGVLRADNSPGSSFVHVQRTMTTDEIYTFEANPVITDAMVRITDLAAVGDSSWIFTMATDTSQDGFYSDSAFTPIPGHQYALEIDAPSLPTLMDTVTIPELPVISDTALVSGKFSFNLHQSIETRRYDIYLHFQNGILVKQVNVVDSTNTFVQFAWTSAEIPTELTVIGLDKHLVDYGSSSISFIPNTYHEDGSTVTGGYGCFGAAAVLEISLN